MIGRWLLCDFHIHTKYSDGQLSLNEVIEFYGTRGFDAIAITDHILDSRTVEQYRENKVSIPAVTEDDFTWYMETLWRAAETAWKNYNMVLLPGAEITNNSNQYHILALDIKRYISPDHSVEGIVNFIKKQGGLSVACHPHERQHSSVNQSKYLWENHSQFAGLFDAWEVANRNDLFKNVGHEKYPIVASSDFHEPGNIYSWKTLLHCEKHPESIKSTLRRNQDISVMLYRKEREALTSNVQNGNGVKLELVNLCD